jgi:hypothetical protein
MWKYEDEAYGDNITMYRVGAARAFTGSLMPNNMTPDFPAIQADNLKVYLRNQGAKATAGLMPTRPDFTAVSSLYELKDLLPGIKEALQDIRSRVRKESSRIQRKSPAFGGTAADLYLAYKFGYEPLMKDIRTFFEAFSGRKKRFDQLLRDEGKPVRRSVNLSGENRNKADTSSYTEYNTGAWNANAFPHQVTQCYPQNASGHSTYVSGKSSRTWAEGKARYLLPPGPRDDQWNKALYRKIMGVDFMSPSQLYNMIPWSWLVDYFTGLGDFMSAVDAGVADRIWFDYAYTMHSEEYWKKAHHTTYYYSSKNGSVSSASSKRTVSRTVKMRDFATPFGFGLEDSLSDHQMSILGAMGYSRLAR